MEEYLINNEESFNEMIAYFIEEKPSKTVKNNLVITDRYSFELEPEYFTKFSQLLKEEPTNEYQDDLIYGKDKTNKVVTVEIVDDKVRMLLLDGTVVEKPNFYWILASKPLDIKFKPLNGRLHYKYIRKFIDKNEYNKFYSIYKKQQKDIFTIRNEQESAMVYHGITLFKDMRIEDLSVLSFDIEASGLVRDSSSKVYIITNTLRKNSEIIKKQFVIDDYEDGGQLIKDWEAWVREADPDILVGHNVFGYDLDYLNHIAGLHDITINLGRDGSALNVSNYSSEYRVDGSQSWEYRNIRIFGRHIIDTAFSSVKYDIAKNYPSWKLKEIIEYEELVKTDRQFYDASLINKNWDIPEEKAKIIQYCEDDSDDALALFDLQLPSFFYMNQSIPKTFQAVINSASGSWLNSILIRSYLQNGHSIPCREEPSPVSGGISFGNPGLHKNVFKIDVKSMYPSIIRSYEIYNKTKDPLGNFLKMVDVFTLKRFEYQDKFEETKEKYYDDIQASNKILINSCYGLLSTPGLAFNSFKDADRITGIGRQIILKTVRWATGKNLTDYWTEYDGLKDEKYQGILKAPTIERQYHLVNADTDSISFSSEGFDETLQKSLLAEINNMMPDMIKYTNDGVYNKILVLKAKNYVLSSVDKKTGKVKVKKKGSSITDSKKEFALLAMIDELISSLMDEKGEEVQVYHKYIKEAANITDIKRWSTKKNITKSVLNPERANEQKVLDALVGLQIREGDKYHIYSAIDGVTQDTVKGKLVFSKKGVPKMVPNRILKLVDNWTGDEDKTHYLERVYKTVDILCNVLDMNNFIKYHNVKNASLIEQIEG